MILSFLVVYVIFIKIGIMDVEEEIFPEASNSLSYSLVFRLHSRYIEQFELIG
jgi:hypothetical protein